MTGLIRGGEGVLARQPQISKTRRTRQRNAFEDSGRRDQPLHTVSDGWIERPNANSEAFSEAGLR